MAYRTVQSSRQIPNTARRDYIDITDDGEGRGRDDREVIDLVEGVEEGSSEDEDSEDEDSEDEDSEDEDSENGDQVTETGEAQSEKGKQPIFHHEIYDRLVKLMSSQGAYTHEPPDDGVDSMDITSFHPDQRDWSFTRPHRAPVLSLWSKVPGSTPTYPIGYLLFNGRLVLDYAGYPIKAFHNLPLTISSAVGGFRIETWIRQDIRRLKVDDILARLRTRSTSRGREPLQKRGVIYDRAHHFRLEAGLIPFRIRNEPNRNAARIYLDSLRTPAQRASNQAIDRDLTADELATVKEIGKGGRVNAAGGSSADQSPRTSIVAQIPIVASPSISRPSRHHPSSRPPPETPTTPVPTQSLSDSREDVPKTLRESYLLNDALSETIQHFRKLTGQNPKPTNVNESYASQWNALQAQFVPIWKSQRPAEEMASLFKLTKWTGGIARWENDWRTQVGGEEKCEADAKFLEYMDATAEGSAYLGLGGKWRSVRDTWCNSHREGRPVQIDLTSGEDPEESSEESSEQASEEDSVE